MEKATFAVYEFGPYRLDAAKRLLLYEGKSLTLAPKTFDLLHLLVQSQGRVLTKKELMSALWPDSFVEEANLAFQVSALRKVLGAKGAEWIETLPRYGYRFSAPVSQLAVQTAEDERSEDDGADAETTAERHFQVAALGRPAGRQTKILQALAAIAVVSALVFGWLRTREGAPRARVVRFLILPPPKITILDLDSIALSPDGSRLAFIGEASDGQKQLWLRPWIP